MFAWWEIAIWILLLGAIVGCWLLGLIAWWPEIADAGRPINRWCFGEPEHVVRFKQRLAADVQREKEMEAIRRHRQLELLVRTGGRPQ